ncbi:BatD family protein [Photobacterium minamisatsumaniensis]|uniref:BatD family protein n=1 Tax=Photobacterium minamisatsumaniensis TaxID=2910233 RepID=UPI003D0BE03E
MNNTMVRIKRLLLLCIVSIGVFCGQTVLATEVNESSLSTQDKNGLIEVKAWLGDSAKEGLQTYAINEQIILNIEVSTPRWLTGGTRIGSIEMPDVIVKQRNTLATNYTERRNGQTWSIQHWEITLYPQASGQYRLPPIAVGAQVSAPGGNNVRATLYTEPLSFMVNLPSVMLSDEVSWLAASDVSVQQDWTVMRGTDSRGVQDVSQTVLKVGDVVTRKVKVEGTDTLSVLIPPLIAPTLGDVQSYAQPDVLIDSQVRGKYISSREEEVTYVIQSGGEVTLSPIAMYWWNTKTKQLEVLQVEGRTFSVKHTFRSMLTQYGTVLFMVMVGLLGCGFGAREIRRFYTNRPLPLWLQFVRALKNKQWATARVLVYRKQRYLANQLELSRYCSESHWQKKSRAVQLNPPSRFMLISIWFQLKRPFKKRHLIPRALPLDKLA